jgi:3-phenylpropionate/trans-cinnamate dioxygenase ferredoxin subunit
MKHALFPLADLEPGQMKAAVVDGDGVVVARDRDGTVYAMRDRCPHSGAPLSRGRLLEKVVADDVDEYELTDELILRCPWHGFEFELSSGRCLADPRRTRARPYRVTIEDGTIWVERGSFSGAE